MLFLRRYNNVGVYLPHPPPRSARTLHVPLRAGTHLYMIFDIVLVLGAYWALASQFWRFTKYNNHLAYAVVLGYQAIKYFAILQTRDASHEAVLIISFIILASWYHIVDLGSSLSLELAALILILTLHEYFAGHHGGVVHDLALLSSFTGHLRVYFGFLHRTSPRVSLALFESSVLACWAGVVGILLADIWGGDTHWYTFALLGAVPYASDLVNSNVELQPGIHPLHYDFKHLDAKQIATLNWTRPTPSTNLLESIPFYVEPDRVDEVQLFFESHVPVEPVEPSGDEETPKAAVEPIDLFADLEFN